MSEPPATTSPALTSALSDAISVVQTLRDAGHVAYLAGGCVRDRLLGIEPKDYDVATDAPPAKVQSLFKRTQAVGAAFGVILVQVGKSKIEVATFRADGAYSDGRRPESVRFTSAEEDAQRRDFTINGLFLDPVDGRVIDYVGGQADLAAKRLRAIGVASERFAEDHLRMLRAVRFAARFDFKIEPATFSAIAKEAGKISLIAAERVADELRRILIPPSRQRAVDWLMTSGLMTEIFASLYITDRPPEAMRFFIGKSASLLEQLPGDKDISFGTAILAAAIDVRHAVSKGKHERIANLAPAEIKKIVRFARLHLKLSNEELTEMEGIALSLHMLLTTREPPVAMLKRFLARSFASAARMLLAAIRELGEAVDRVIRVEAALAQFDGTDVAPVPLLTGNRLIAAGAVPGPAFRTVLDAVYDAQLEGKLVSEEDALAMGIELLKTAR